VKMVALLALSLLTAVTAVAEDAGGIADFNGEKVVLSPDFTWRFDDSGGVRCTTVGATTTLCALPSIWTPVPHAIGFGPRWFRQGTDLTGSVTVLDSGASREPITIGIVMRRINGDRGKDSDFGLSAISAEAKIAGVKATTLVSVIGTTQTRAYSFAFLGDGKVVLATTVEDHSFMYSLAHKAAHASFVNSIRLEGEQ
jgi:hypothetical protein